MGSRRSRTGVTVAGIAALERSVRGTVARDPKSLARVVSDASPLSAPALAVVAPVDAEDVLAIVAWARKARVGLVPRGGGTSLAGGAVPVGPTVVVDLAAWNTVVEVNASEGWARVGPGLVNLDFQRALQPLGMFFPPNPGSWTRSTLGGNLGTNASGPRSFRYGPTRTWIRALEIVLGNGRRVRLGTRALKRSAGPDLLSFVVGSEGTLGIVTEITARLAPLPQVREAFVVPVPPTARLGAVASRLSQAAGTGLSAVEYVDGTCASAMAERRRSLHLTGEALLLLEIEADDARQAARRRARVLEMLSSEGVSSPATEVAPEALWTLRGEAGTLLDATIGPRVREDVAVPLGRLDELVEALRRIASEEGMGYHLYGHLGEGSLHPNFAVDPTGERGNRVRARVVRTALALGGTVSAEHGIGLLKVPFLVEELGPGAVDWLVAVKRWCDPDGILNPGKVYPER